MCQRGMGSRAGTGPGCTRSPGPWGRWQPGGRPRAGLPAPPTTESYSQGPALLACLSLLPGCTSRTRWASASYLLALSEGLTHVQHSRQVLLATAEAGNKDFKQKNRGLRNWAMPRPTSGHTSSRGSRGGQPELCIS